MVTFIITASLELQPPLMDEVEMTFLEDILQTRKLQYRTSLRNTLAFAESIQARVIVVENNGPRKTLFEEFQCEVLYTDTNQCAFTKGTAEFLDILSCIHTFQIPDEEMIVKTTGRYLIDTGGAFCQALRSYEPDKTDCILRYGSFINPEKDEPQEDCLTGLIGMKCKYIKQIQHKEGDCVEHNWARMSLRLDPTRVLSLRGPIGYRMFSWNTKNITFRDL